MSDLITSEMLDVAARAETHAEALEAAAPMIVADVLAKIEEAIGGLRDILVATDDGQGSYLVAAVLDKALSIARLAATP